MNPFCLLYPFQAVGKSHQALRLCHLVLMLAGAILLTGCGDEPQQSWQLTEKGGLASARMDSRGEHVVVGSVWHGGSLWRLSDGARMYDWNHTDGESSVFVATAFSADGNKVATAERHAVAVWDRSTGRPGGFWKTEAGVRSLAMSGDGRWLLVGLFDGAAMLVDVQIGLPAGRIWHPDVINAVAIDRDGRIIVTGSDDGAVRVWNLEDGSERLAWQYPAAVSSIALSADGRFVYTARVHGKGEVRDMATGRVISEIGHDRTSMVASRFSGDGNRLLTATPSGRIILWDVNSGEQLAQWVARRSVMVRPTSMVTLDVALDETRRRVLAVFSDGSMRAWSMP